MHTHSVNGKTFDKDCVAVIEAIGAKEGRDMAWGYFGPKFFTTYHEDQWNEDNLKYFPRGYINVENTSNNNS